tara:strand:+ start:23519 stop:23899 length:381 start_codon:yes stop_codon:yes gene_type:complete
VVEYDLFQTEDVRMAKKQYIMQTGMGADLHGANDTTAARRAVKDAIQHNNMLFLKHVGLKSLDQLLVEVIVASPNPDAVDKEAVAEDLPVGVVSVQTQSGGMLVDADESGDPVLVAIAAVTVSVQE